jgi:hypothetical protein
MDREAYSSVLTRLPGHYAGGIEEFIKCGEHHGHCGDSGKFEFIKESGIFTPLTNHAKLEIARRCDLSIIEPDDEFVRQIGKLEKSIIFMVAGELELISSLKRIHIPKDKLFRFRDLTNPADLRIDTKGGKCILLSMRETALQELIFDFEDSFFPLVELIEEMNFNPEYHPE